MRARWIGIGTGAVATVALGAIAGAIGWPSLGAATSPPSLPELAARAVGGEDEAAREAAIEALRARGPEGHAALLRAHADGVAALRAGRLPPEGEALRHAIDVVSGQRDGHASGLYWHTDLEAAQRDARRTGRPILSLRLLGRLDEELSCASSRFFRIVLYSDPEIARTLSEQFVLHWSSERPAPRIEIDMGDGRRMVRTITGNSAHYVLDADGRPLDAIVGLYAPDQFRAVLARARARFEECASQADACLARAHEAAQQAQREAWIQVRARDGALPEWETVLASFPDAGAGEDAPSAFAAMPLTTSKARIETPMLELLRRNARGASAPPAEPDWLRVAMLRGEGVAPLAEATRALLRLKTGRSDVDATAAELAREAAADGARNELLFHRRVHAILAAERPDFAALNARVYAELLRTPASDPWLGLRADDLYDGLEVARR